jgi:3-hydroxyacyl-[acyl-carrier-protein] dehydratase
MKSTPKGNLRLGSNVVELLLPHRRPFLMVDFIHGFHPDPIPTLEAGRQISANDRIFDGHFPGLYVWPGALTIEGLGQTGVLLLAIVALRKAAQSEGRDPESVLDALRQLDLGFRMQAEYRPEAAGDLVKALESARSLIAVGTSVEMKFPRPVFAGQQLDYMVRVTGQHAAGMRFEAEASVEGNVVAKGVLMGAAVTRPTFPGSR